MACLEDLDGELFGRILNTLFEVLDAILSTNAGDVFLMRSLAMYVNRHLLFYVSLCNISLKTYQTNYKLI